jgi:cytochrome c oxidase cbb3-type subunit III
VTTAGEGRIPQLECNKSGARIPSVKCRSRIAAGLTLLGLGAISVGCEREDRVFREAVPGATAFPAVRTSDLEAGPTTTDPAVGAYQENRWAVSQGQMLFTQFNCAVCHSPGGGGGMGPPLTDDVWIYGSDPENIFATVIEGRPNGMPAFRGKVGNAQVWQLVAYVRSMSGLTPRDTWPARSDDMQQTKPDREPAPGFKLP